MTNLNFNDFDEDFQETKIGGGEVLVNKFDVFRFLMNFGLFGHFLGFLDFLKTFKNPKTMRVLIRYPFCQFYEILAIFDLFLSFFVTFFIKLVKKTS